MQEGYLDYSSHECGSTADAGWSYVRSIYDMACNLSSAEPSVRAVWGEYATTLFSRKAQDVVDQFASSHNASEHKLLLQLAYNAIVRCAPTPFIHHEAHPQYVSATL